MSLQMTSPAAARITVVGGANMDVGAQTQTPLLPGDSTPGHIHYAPGGVGRNIAENLARLGSAVALVSVVGDDAFGHDILAHTRSVGVDVSGVKALAGQRTATYLSMHGPDGDMALAVNDMAILESLTPALLETEDAMPARTDVLVLDCNLSAPTLAWLLEQATQPVFVDAVSVAKCQRLVSVLGRVHTLKVNRIEAQALCGAVVDTVDDARRAALALHGMGVQRVVLSLGALGVAWCDADGSTGVRAATAVPVVNTTGAGDALLAGLVHAHALGLSLPRSVEYAMACAEITLSSTFANALDLSHAVVQSRLAAVAA
jgi:pseudouridine kinase